MFVPLGFFLPKFTGRIDKCWKALGIGLFISLIIEITQFITHRGFFDVDDLFLNTLGSVIGWLYYRRLLKTDSGCK